MSHNPRVSILLPVHNGMPFLVETVESVLRQSLKDFELIVLDDGSTDEGPAYLQSLGDDRVRYHRLERVGLVTALNEGLRLARADIIARIDADDLAAPTRLEEQLQFLQANPRCVLLGCDYWEIDVQGNVISENPFKMTSDLALRFQLFFSATFSHPGVVFPRKVVGELGGYRTQFDVSEDYDLFSRLALRGTVACLPRKLLSKRIHGGAVSTVHRERGLKQSSVIAKNYVAAMFPDFDARSIGDLYLLHQGRSPEQSTPADLWCTFKLLCDSFSELHGPLPEEVVQTIREVRYSLGWQSLRNARSRPSNLKQSLDWFVAARRFEPGELSFRAAIRRRIRRLGTRLAATVQRREPGLAR
ncbi:glycosyltransferase [Singulisphaera sp. Ch08]|uniref:Glycosyltransferase n=1 Tax=Singulisphaera sp. Ch08 TaxID=3120278 RepID=A0AAU7CDU5_9BACT